MPEASIDIEFAVPYVHRLRVTDDVAGGDFEQLLSVLERGDGGPAKVLIVAELPVIGASDRVQQISRQLGEAAEIDLVAPVIQVPGGEA
ncbi:MAG: 3-dehydroquinate synthase, partial [Pirellulales bacterium]|nr:3-dehydroquinate synthase [Pirellulales bacterium]